MFRWDVSRSEIKYNLIPNTSLRWLFYYRTLITLMRFRCTECVKKTDAHDSLTCVNFRILLDYVIEKEY